MMKVTVKCAKCDGTGRMVTGQRSMGRMAGSGYHEWMEDTHATCSICLGEGKHETEAVDEPEGENPDQ